MKSIDVRSERAIEYLVEFLDVDGERKNTLHFVHGMTYASFPFSIWTNISQKCTCSFARHSRTFSCMTLQFSTTSLTKGTNGVILRVIRFIHTAVQTINVQDSSVFTSRSDCRQGNWLVFGNHTQSPMC